MLVVLLCNIPNGAMLMCEHHVYLGSGQATLLRCCNAVQRHCSTITWCTLCCPCLFADDLAAHNCIILMDDTVPQDEMFFQPTIVFTSPKYEQIRRCLKSVGANEMLMPPWNLWEMLQAACVLQVDYVDVLKQYNTWGGALRQVVNAKKYPREMLDECIRKVPDPLALVRSNIGLAPVPGVPNSLVHIDVTVSNCVDDISAVPCQSVHDHSGWQWLGPGACDTTRVAMV